MTKSNYFKSISEINDTLYAEYFGNEERLKNDTYTLDNNVPIKTGLKQLDNIIGPISLNSLYLIGSRPAMGKTSLMIDMALNMAKYKPVYKFSLESDATYLAKRILSIISDINLITLGDKPLKNDETEKIKQGIKTLDKLPIYICDKAPITLKELIELAEARDGIVFIDYLQLIEINNFNDIVLTHNEIADTLRDFVNRTGIPVIVLSQINRSVERRENKRPTLEDISYSKRIAECADTVIFIYRKAYYSHKDHSTDAELIVAKNKRGKTGTAIVQFDNKTGNFFE